MESLDEWEMGNGDVAERRAKWCCIDQMFPMVLYRSDVSNGAVADICAKWCSSGEMCQLSCRGDMCQMVL